MNFPQSEYHSRYREFRHKSSWSDSEPIPFHGTEFYNPLFTSRNAGHLCGRPSYRCDEHELTFEGRPIEGQPPDFEIQQNIRFRYPLIAPTGSGRPHRRVTILLHGLNERTYSKYLPWAYELCIATGAPVLLFPLALHVNRVLPAWSTRQAAICERRQRMAGNQFAHRFNAIVSERLEELPERFFWGAVQSYLDLVDLASDIRAGRHAHFTADTRLDFLGYSAGGYVSFFLMLENPEGLFSDSRAALFATCAPARDLNLASPLILDLAAETALMKKYVKNIDQGADPRMRHWLECHAEGRWFRALSGTRTNRQKVEARVREIAPRLLGIANINDDVTPWNALLDTFQGLRRDTGVRVEELDLGLHENPFVDLGGNLASRKGLIEFVDEERYGREFERFIAAVAAHLG